MRRLLAACVAVLTWVVAPCASAYVLRIDGALEPRQAARANELVADVATRLPPRWRDALPDSIALEFRDDLPREVHGRALHDRILLRRALLDAPGRQATAALLHELAHLLDRRLHLARDPRLLDLAGWQRGVVGGRASRNVHRDRTPDPYELTHPREFVAVNLEHFLLDADYGCRRPALARYLAQRLGAMPASPACAPDHAFVQADAAGDAEASPLLRIDPARVAAVDLLLAEPGDAAMSRWGHAMLRLVICAPERERGPDCRLDLAHHRVLSFRAFVGDVQISSWRGLIGAYPSRLFVLPLSQVVDEYTKGELRGVQSLPLALDRAEIDALVEHASQLHWSLDARYRFVTRNCATETARLLHDAVPRLQRMDIHSLTPTGLTTRLLRARIADATVLDDREQAVAQGHYFPSQATQYQALFEVADAALSLPARNARDWLALHPSRRGAFVDQADLRAAAALLVLEGAALRRLEHRARDVLKHRLGRRSAKDDALRVREALGLMDALARPAALLPHGYGLPQQHERERVDADAEAMAARWREASARLHADARAWLPQRERAAIEAAEANVERLGLRLRALHRQANGLELSSAAQ